MDVCDVKVTNEDGFLAGSMMINAKNTILMKKRIRINCVARRLVFLSLHPDTGALLHQEIVSLPQILLARCH